MEIRQIRCFAAVAEHLNFTEAAKRLNIVQSVVSHHIAELEKELGVKLLIRGHKSVCLTAIGEIFLKDAIRIITLSDEATQKIRDYASGVVGRLNIGFIANDVINNLSESFENFRMTWPDVFLNFNEAYPSLISELLEKGDIDIGFTRPISVQNNPTLKYKTLYTDTISIVVPVNHPVAKQTSVDIATLSREPYILINRKTGPGLFDMGMKLCISNGFMPKIVSQPNHMETILMMVQIGLGITILPRCYKTADGSKLCFVDIESDDALVDLVVAWNERNLNPAIPLFLMDLKANAQIDVQNKE